MYKSLLIHIAFLAAVAANRLPIALKGRLTESMADFVPEVQYESEAMTDSGVNYSEDAVALNYEHKFMADSVPETSYETKAMADRTLEVYESEHMADYLLKLKPIPQNLPYESQSMAELVAEVEYGNKALAEVEVNGSNTASAVNYEHKFMADSVPETTYETKVMADSVLEASYESKSMADRILEVYESEHMADYLIILNPIRQRLPYESQSMADLVNEIAYEIESMDDVEESGSDNAVALTYEHEFMAAEVPETSYETKAMADSTSKAYESQSMADIADNRNIARKLVRTHVMNASGARYLDVDGDV